MLLTITPDGVRRPVAHATLAFMLALSTTIFQKDRITRAGRWDDRFDYIGIGLTGRTLGLVGLGNIGREVIDLPARSACATSPSTPTPRRRPPRRSASSWSIWRRCCATPISSRSTAR